MSVEQHGAIDVPGHLQAILSEVRSLQQQQRVMIAALDSLGALLDEQTPPTATETLQATRVVWDVLHTHRARLDGLEARLSALSRAGLKDAEIEAWRRVLARLEDRLTALENPPRSAAAL